MSIYGFKNNKCKEEILEEIAVSPTKPTTNEKVWIDNANGKIYVKNENGIYEEFVNAETMGIETKSDNINGTAIKYPDGTMICTKKVDLGGIAVTTAVGSLYSSSDLELGDFAESFIELPTCNITIRSNDSLGFLGFAKNMSASSVGQIRIYRPTPLDTNTYTAHIQATGRWK